MSENITMTELTQELVRNLFTYKSGFLYWKARLNQRIKIGDKAGTFNDRYYRIGINGKLYTTHRLIFLYHNGYLPKYIDHIDNNSMNNNIENLRETTVSQNQMNRKVNKNASSQYKGISWNKHAKKWYVQIRINGRKKHLGNFEFEIDAALAYNTAAIKYYGEYAKLNEVK